MLYGRLVVNLLEYGILEVNADSLDSGDMGAEVDHSLCANKWEEVEEDLIDDGW